MAVADNITAVNTTIAADGRFVEPTEIVEDFPLDLLDLTAGYLKNFLSKAMKVNASEEEEVACITCKGCNSRVGEAAYIAAITSEEECGSNSCCFDHFT